MRCLAFDSRAITDVGAHSNISPSGSGIVLLIRGARRPASSRLGGVGVFLGTGLVLDPWSVPGLRVLHPGRFLALAGVLTDFAAGRPVPGARLLFPRFSCRASILCSVFRRLFGPYRFAWPLREVR